MNINTYPIMVPLRTFLFLLFLHIKNLSKVKVYGGPLLGVFFRRESTHTRRFKTRNSLPPPPSVSSATSISTHTHTQYTVILFSHSTDESFV